MVDLGTTIKETYVLYEKIYDGTNSTVFLSANNRSGIKYAVKVTAKSAGEIIIKSAKREIDILKNNKIPGIPSYIDDYEDNNFIYLIRQFIPGDSLKERLNGDLFNIEQVHVWAEALCKTISKLHEKKILVIDIKPSNVIIDDQDRVWLVDFFGSMRMNPKEECFFIGTPSIAPCELFGENKEIDERTDIYGIGGIMLEMADHVIDNQKVGLDKYREVAEKCHEYYASDRYSFIQEAKKGVSDSHKTGFRIIGNNQYGNVVNESMMRFGGADICMISILLILAGFVSFMCFRDPATIKKGIDRLFNPSVIPAYILVVVLLIAKLVFLKLGNHYNAETRKMVFLGVPLDFMITFAGYITSVIGAKAINVILSVASCIIICGLIMYLEPAIKTKGCLAVRTTRATVYFLGITMIVCLSMIAIL